MDERNERISWTETFRFAGDSAGAVFCSTWTSFRPITDAQQFVVHFSPQSCLQTYIESLRMQITSATLVKLPG